MTVPRRPEWLALAPVLVGACCPSVPSHSTTESVPCDYCDGDCVDETQEVAKVNNHVPGDVVYDDPPPTSGDHNACWATWGLHAADPGDENWVHNLEHGGVVFLYRPSDCDDDANDCAAEASALEAILGSASDRRWIIAPYEQSPTAWAAVSWGRRQLMGCFDLGAMQEFFDAHVGQAREDTNADPPATCPEG